MVDGGKERGQASQSRSWKGQRENALQGDAPVKPSRALRVRSQPNACLARSPSAGYGHRACSPSSALCSPRPRQQGPGSQGLGQHGCVTGLLRGQRAGRAVKTSSLACRLSGSTSEGGCQVTSNSTRRWALRYLETQRGPEQCPARSLSALTQVVPTPTGHHSRSCSLNPEG